MINYILALHQVITGSVYNYTQNYKLEFFLKKDNRMIHSHVKNYSTYHMDVRLEEEDWEQRKDLEDCKTNLKQYDGF